MEKLNLLVLFALPLANTPSLNAQIVHNPGVVTFQNTEAARPPGQPLDFHLIYGFGAPLVGTQYSAELYYLDTTTSSLAPIPATISSFKAPTTSAPGTWNGPAGPVPLPAGYGGVDVLGDLSGEAGDGSGTGFGYYPVTFRVRFWDSTGGASTWETALVRAQTTSFAYLQRYTGASTDTEMINQPGIAVPEPSAIVLSLLGVGGMILFRRRKSFTSENEDGDGSPR